MTEPDQLPADQGSNGPEATPAGPSFRQSWVGRAYAYFCETGHGRYNVAFIVLIVGALVLRLWELSGRTMHYDEAIHLYYAWRLAQLEGFVHSPWMHGPLQIDLVALFLRLVGDTDFIARLPYALIGAALVGLPFLMRESLGRSGALLTGVLLAVSPSLLYFSRFGRNDIIMAFLAVSLFALLWHHVRFPRNRNLYLAAAALALAFTAKESAYILAALFGLLALLLAIATRQPGPQSQNQPPEANQESGHVNSETGAANAVRRWGARLFPPNPTSWRLSELRRTWPDLRNLNPAAGFLVLLVTLSLPLWAAAVELAREVAATLAALVGWEGAAQALERGFGLTLALRDGAAQGIVGVPAWEAPFLQLPLDQPGPEVAAVLWTLAVVGCALQGYRSAASWAEKISALGIPLASASIAAVALFRPLGGAGDLLLVGALAIGCGAAFHLLRIPWRRSFLLAYVPFVITLAYCVLFLTAFDLDALLSQTLVAGVWSSNGENLLALNVLVAAAIILVLTTIAVAVGLAWRGGVWLVCAGIFFGIWVTLYTTAFTNMAGLFSGSWQGLGYWIAQQEVARGNQPWYYYFVGMSLYEFLPFFLGILGAIHFVRRRDRFGMALAFWAGVNMLAYTVASEKMPWLLVNITLPFIFLAGKLLGEMVERVDWGNAFGPSQHHSSQALLLIPTALFCGAGFVALRLLGPDASFDLLAYLVAAILILIALWGARLIRQMGSTAGPALASLGVAGFLLALTIWTSFQAAYTFDDSRREILVYAQGSADLQQSFREINDRLLTGAISSPTDHPVRIDYDTWFPLQWYLRRHTEDGYTQFTCFKNDGSGGCAMPGDGAAASALLVASHNQPTAENSDGAIQGFDMTGPRRNLLWFPETYRRPGENRQSEGFGEELREDLLFFRDAATSGEKWRQALRYFLTRDMESDWFNTEYYTYRSRETLATKAAE